MINYNKEAFEMSCSYSAQGSYSCTKQTTVESFADQGVRIYRHCVGDPNRLSGEILGVGTFTPTSSGLSARQKYILKELSSIDIPSGYQVTLYNNDPNIKPVTLTSSLGCFDQYWNDKVKQITVTKL